MVTTKTTRRRTTPSIPWAVGYRRSQKYLPHGADSVHLLEEYDGEEEVGGGKDELQPGQLAAEQRDGGPETAVFPSKC